MKKTIIIFILASFSISGYSQCADTANIYTFTYNGKMYEIVKENKSWTSAAACAVERGGYLAEINDSLEQIVLDLELVINAGIDISKTIAPDGGGASYVWIGGNDLDVEGKWIWDGNNDTVGPQFWQGTFNGNPVGGLYNNWGDEPDNFGGQDCLGFSLSNWPFGVAGEWNDVSESNTLYYVIEYNGGIGIGENKDKRGINIYPNPAHEYVFIRSNNMNYSITKIEVINAIGQNIETKQYGKSELVKFDISQLNVGFYYLRVQFADGTIDVKKIIKE